MIITRKKTVEEHFEIAFPCYIKNDNSFYALASLKSALRVCLIEEYAAINTDSNLDIDAVSRMLNDGEFISASCFGEAFIKATERIAESLPSVDGLKLNIHPSTLVS